jgi:hypothetical protein
MFEKIINNKNNKSKTNSNIIYYNVKNFLFQTIKKWIENKK